VEIFNETAAPNRVIDTSTDGYLSVGGNWVDNSDRNSKEQFEQVDTQDVLERLADLPVTTWNYKAEGPDTRHMGPVAQDFHGRFGLGGDDKHISALDANGVALAGIQGLYRIIREKDAEIATLRKQQAEMQARLAALEAKMSGERP
jgi:hypothetical protein